MYVRMLLIGMFALGSVEPNAVGQSPAPGFRLIAPVNSTTTRLLDPSGRAVHTWRGTHQPGLAVYLLDDGTLLRTINTGTLSGTYGGVGGGVQKVRIDGSVIWDYRYDGPGVWSHHDIEPLPNGNVLLIAYEDRTPAEAVAAGRNPAWVSTVFRPDHIVEIQPTGRFSGEIVWEWHAWDHLIQDFDPAQANYGVVRDHPELVDINYPPGGSATDWNHANGIDYDPVHDWIVLSVRRMHEIWVIDHSTTTAEAASHAGGNYGVGGDLLYRWGNPQVYGRGSAETRTLFGQHAANFIPPGYPGAGNILLFNNDRPGGSAVQEIVLPLDASARFILDPGESYGPAGPTWEYAGGFQSSIMSSAFRAQNGNTLICSGAQGLVIEIDAALQQVSEISTGQTLFHAHYVERFLWESRKIVSAEEGGTVRFSLMGGLGRDGHTYLVLGSASGTSPGTQLGGQLIPLNVDSYFYLTLGSPGVFPLGQTLGTLNKIGRAEATLTVPPGVSALSGLRLDHAFVTLPPGSLAVNLVSNTVPLDIR